MGYYIDPKDKTKEAWLNENGTRTSVADAKAHTVGDQVLVCLVDNGIFTAAGIAYDDQERDAFLVPDHRPKSWYLVDRNKLKPYCARL